MTKTTTKDNDHLLPGGAWRGGITGLFIGSPGVGKSEMLGSVGEVTDAVRLLAPKPREINSRLYRAYGFDQSASVFTDHRWRPSLDVFEADAFLRLEREVLGLYEDEEVKVVILDPLTDVVMLAAHDLLKSEKAATPKDLRDTLSFYGALKYKLKTFTQSLVGLASPDVAQPKHVFVAVHAQPTKEEDIKGNPTADKVGRGVEFEGEVLPMIEGGYRREIAGEFDIVGYNFVQHETVREGNKFVKKTDYLVQLGADSERHAKVALARLPEKIYPNHMPTILEAVADAGLNE